MTYLSLTEELDMTLPFVCQNNHSVSKYSDRTASSPSNLFFISMAVLRVNILVILSLHSEKEIVC